MPLDHPRKPASHPLELLSFASFGDLCATQDEEGAFLKGVPEVCEAPFSQAFYACANSGLESLGRARPGRGRGRKPLSPGKGSLVGAENEEGEIKGNPDKWKVFPTSCPSFSPPLEPALGPRQKHASVFAHASSSPWFRELPQPRLLDKPRIA